MSNETKLKSLEAVIETVEKPDFSDWDKREEYIQQVFNVMEKHIETIYPES